MPLRKSERTYCNTVAIGATTRPPRRSSAGEIRPCLLQPPIRDREWRLQLLREEGNLKLLEQPAELLEAGLDPPCLAVALDALAIALPPSGDRGRVLRVPARIFAEFDEAAIEGREVAGHLGELCPGWCGDESRIHERVAAPPQFGSHR